MVMHRPARKVFFALPTVLLAFLLLLAACGSSSKSSSGSSGASSTHPANSSTAIAATTTATASAATFQKYVSFIGSPTVKMLAGATFESVGQLKNIDTFQHDITMQVVLKDAAGKVIATGTQFLDNVKAGTTVSYAIKGTTSQPTWVSAEVTIIKVSENINGSGGD
jgi:hypothetical protein